MTIHSQRGMTLVEASIILSVVAILSAVMAPAINGYIEQARQARTREDVKTIAEAIQAFITDTAEHQFLINGSNGTTYGDKEPPTRPDSNRVDLLVSDGDIAPYATALGATESFWTQAVTSSGTVDTLENHLVENTRMTLGIEPKDSTKRYRNPTDITITSVGSQNIDFARTESSGFNAPHAWRGPYIGGPVDPDPWGNRYAVNVLFLDPAPVDAVASLSTGFTASSSAYSRLDVFVLSAGADEEIDTKSAQDGAVPGDDDFIYLVSSHAK